MLVGYARVSTRDQSNDMQIKALEAAGCEKIFTEKASGAQRDRPQLKAALEFLREGDCLVVWKLDRLARSVSQLISTADDLSDQGIALQSLTEGIQDTSTPIGKFFIHTLGILSEFERDVKRERTYEGLAAARARGAKLGRPCAMNKEDIEAAKALLASGNFRVADVIKRTGVSKATFYKHVPDPRSYIPENPSQQLLI